MYVGRYMIDVLTNAFANEMVSQLVTEGETVTEPDSELLGFVDRVRIVQEAHKEQQEQFSNQMALMMEPTTQMRAGGRSMNTS